MGGGAGKGKKRFNYDSGENSDKSNIAWMGRPSTLRCWAAQTFIMKKIRRGRYQHYKGNLYEVIGIVRHSETLEELVLYKALYKTKFGPCSYWVRPKGMFEGRVKVQGVLVPRFQFIKLEKKGKMVQKNGKEND